MVEVLLWLVFLYECEKWTMLTAEINKLIAFKMWLWKRLETISWKKRISNHKVLTMINDNSYLIRTINQSKNNWMGRVLRVDRLLKNVVEGRMLGKTRQD